MVQSKAMCTRVNAQVLLGLVLSENECSRASNANAENVPRAINNKVVNAIGTCVVARRGYDSDRVVSGVNLCDKEAHSIAFWPGSDKKMVEKVVWAPDSDASASCRRACCEPLLVSLQGPSYRDCGVVQARQRTEAKACPVRFILQNTGDTFRQKFPA